VTYLIGEWWQANLAMGATLFAAGVGVFGLGWWVLRGDGINRHRHAPGAEEEAAPPRQALTDDQAH
jgi:hypothetical protein